MTKFIIIFILTSSVSFGQQLQNGLILPVTKPETPRGWVYFPSSPLKVYNKPNGIVIGNLVNEINNQESRIYFRNKLNKSTELKPPSIRSISYDNSALSYFARSNEFVKIVNAVGNLWVSEKELESSNFKMLEWPQYLSENTENVVGYFPNDPGLNLRDSPSVKGKLMKTLIGETFVIKLSNQTNGLWAKVKVLKYKDSSCEGGAAEYELEGWIKLIDDNGLPNVHFYFDC